MVSEEIKEQFREVIRYSQGIQEPKVDGLFDTFKEKKYFFYHLFGDRLIWEDTTPRAYHFTQKERDERVDAFLSKVQDHYDQYTLKCFIEEQREGFFENRVVKDWTYDDIVIRAGTKLLKAFKHFVSDDKMLRKIQDEASAIIQEDKIVGKLCLSIHPLDFLSTSENTLNWRSCHALDGDYKAGNLSYMMDSATIIAYIKTDNDVKLPNFPNSIRWNNKKMRTLIFVSEDRRMILAGRSYPFSNMEVLSIIHEKLTHMINNHNQYSRFLRWSDWNNWQIRTVESSPFWDYKVFLESPYILMPDERLVALDELIIDKSSLHYNDLLYSSVYIPYYSYVGGATSHSTRVEIGGNVPCLYCGDYYITEHSRMMCDDCEEAYGKLDNDDFCFCEECGRHLRIENAIWVNDDSVPVCKYCAPDVVAKCDNCDTKWLLKDLVFHYREYESNPKKYCECCNNKKGNN